MKHGFEIITQPHTIEAFKKIEWQKILDACKNYGYSAHNIGTCGLHLHFSREMFGSDAEKQANSIAKLLYFFEHNHDNLLKASRRNAHELDRWARRYYIDNKDRIVEIENSYNLNLEEGLDYTKYEEVLFNLDWPFTRLITTSLCRRKKKDSRFRQMEKDKRS